VLIENGKKIKKAKTNYVDIKESHIRSDLGKLMSFTQLFPHELGHNFESLFMLHSKENEVSRNVQMHYFSIVTDYNTAFNEGFAEHFENASRYFETNKQIKKGIQSDVEHLSSSLESKKSGFLRDFTFPFRINFYRATTLFWFQPFENLKRYQWVENGNIKFKTKGLAIGDADKAILYRNTGVFSDEKQLRNLVQALSTEGVVSSFFSKLINSSLKNNYLDSNFYKKFLSDSTQNLPNPKQIFNPVQNQYFKIFTVFANYLKHDISEKSKLITFVEGYCTIFPAEKDSVLKIFKHSTGHTFPNSLPIQNWLLVKNINHKIWVMDQFGIFTLPVHTFDINAAEIEDILTIKEISFQEAESIVNYRNSNGFFKTFDDLKKVPGLSGSSVQRIMLCEFDQEFFDKLQNPTHSFYGIIWRGLEHILLKSLVYFAITILIIWFFMYRKQKIGIKIALIRSLVKLAFWLFLVLTAIASVIVISKPLLFFFPIFMVCTGIYLYYYKKDKLRFHEAILTVCLMGVFIIYSLI